MPRATMHVIPTRSPSSKDSGFPFAPSPNGDSPRPPRCSIVERRPVDLRNQDELQALLEELEECGGSVAILASRRGVPEGHVLKAVHQAGKRVPSGSE